MSDFFNKISEKLKSQKLNVVDKDTDRPWGGFFVISEDNAQDFSNIYFNGLNTDRLKVSGKLSPKVLIIAPNKDSHGSTIIEEVKFGKLHQEK